MGSHSLYSSKGYLVGLTIGLLLLPAAARADLESFETDLGRFVTWDSEVGTLAAVQDGAAGHTGGGMILSASGIGVEHYTVLPNTFYMVTGWIQVQSGGTDPFAFSMAAKSGNWDAGNLSVSPGTWLLPAVWEYGADPTNETQWPEDENDWKIIGISVRTGPSDTALSLGFSLVGTGAPAVHVDDVHVTQPRPALVYSFDEASYTVFDATKNGYRYDGTQTPLVTLHGVLPSTPANIRLYVPSWLLGGVGDGLTDGSRETSRAYSGAAWRTDHPGGRFDDGSPVVPLVTTAATIYTANFWMVRDRSEGGNAWTNWDASHASHVAWRLGDNPRPGDIEGDQDIGGSGWVRPNTFHLICQGNANSERNYVPDIHAPGSGTEIDCVDPDGSRYTTMAYQAADTTSWFEACIRGNRPEGTGNSLWIMDDFRLFEHGEEDLVGSLISGVNRDTLKNYR
jgi:hypothetical protein